MDSNAVRKRIIIGSVAALLAALGLILLTARSPENLVFKGRSVKEWSRLVHANNASAVAAMKEIGPQAVPGLIQLLQKRDGFLHRRIWGLRSKLSPKLQKTVLEKLGAPNAVSTREAAARSLGIIGSEARAAVPFLARALQDPDHQLWWEASTAMGHIGRDAVPALIAATDDQNAIVRRAVVYALALVGTNAETAVPALIRRLEDPDQTVRAAADYSVRAITDPLVPRLVKLTRDSSPAMRRQGLERLAVIRPSDGVVTNIFIRALGDPVAEVRLAAVKALRKESARAQAAVPALTQCLQDESALVREWAARALGEIGVAAKMASPEFEQLTGDETDPVREAAKAAGNKIHPP